MDGNVLRRKIEAKSRPTEPPPAGAERAWRLALARSARDAFALAVEVRGLSSARRSLTELLDLPAERSLFAVLEGPGEGLGLAALSPSVLSALIEVQTMGRVSAMPAPVRKPTRTDAAMISGFLDRALADLDQQIDAEEDRVWASGFRYASFLDDPRPLGLLLEDCAYRVLVAEVDLAMGAKAGPLLLALPADGRGTRPAPADRSPVVAGPEASFTDALSEQVLAADCQLEAILDRLTLPLGGLMGWQVGDVLDLPNASLERITFQGLDGRPLAEGRLGQHRGLRAVRLSGASAPAGGSAVVAFPMTGTDD